MASRLTAAIVLGFPAVAWAAQAPEVQPPIVETEAPPRSIELPNYMVTPGTAKAASALALIGGLGAGGIILATANWGRGSAVIATTLVFAPSLGRWLGGDFDRAIWRTGVRLLLVGGASLVLSNITSDSPLLPVTLALVSPIVIAHSIVDIEATSRDLTLDRGVRALSFGSTTRGARMIVLAARY